MYLFLFVVGYSYLSTSIFESQYIAAGCFSLCVATYYNLMFDNNQENRDYFIGFSAVAAINSAYLITDVLQI
jgi:phosphatidylserine synthase